MDGALANTVAKIVKLGATNFAARNHLDLVDPWAVNAVNTLNSGSIRDLTNGKGCVEATTRSSEDDTLENLDSLLAAFDHAIVDLDGITDVEVGDV